MESLVDIGLFLLFLLEYAGYVFAQARLFKYVQADPARLVSFWVGQFAIVVAIAHIGLTLLLIGRVFSLVLLGLLLAAYEFGALVGIVVRALLGTSVVSAWLFGLERATRHPLAVGLGQSIPGVIVLLGYPIAMGIAYFTLEKGSDELLFWVIVLTAATVVISVLWQIMVSMSTLLSPYVDDDLRTQTLISQLMSIPGPALWLAIAYWASAEGDGGVEQGDARGFSVALLALVAFIVAVSVLPYLAGAHRARKQRKSLLERESRLWKRLAETAEIPMRPSYEEDLHGLEQDLTREREIFSDEHANFFTLLELLEDPDSRDELASRGLSFPTGFDSDVPELKLSDPRTRFDAALGRIEGATSELLGEKAQADDGEPKSELAEAWTKAARDRSEEAEKAAVAAAKDRTRGGAAVGFVVTPVMGVVLDQFGVLIWEELSGLV